MVVICATLCALILFLVFCIWKRRDNHYSNSVILNRRVATHLCVARVPQVCRETL